MPLKEQSPLTIMVLLAFIHEEKLDVTEERGPSK